MIEMEMPKDIRKYKTKLIGPFTTRECICLILGVGSAWLFKQNVAPNLPSDVQSFATIGIMVPFVACGWIMPYGLPFEQYAKVLLFTTILSPKVRKYKTELEVENDIRTKKKKLKKHKDKEKNVQNNAIQLEEKEIVYQKKYKSEEFISYK